MRNSTVLCVCLLATFGCLSACSGQATNGNGADDHPHANGNGHDHGQDVSDGHGHGHGPSHELGTARIGEFSVRAIRSGAIVTAGGDVPVDVWIEGDQEPVVAVRFWIGTEDAIGSLKARAEADLTDTQNHWHTHVQAPDPLPDGSMLWVEIETADGTHTGSFDLHTDHAH